MRTKTIPTLLEEYGRDHDVLRRGFVAFKERPDPACTLEDELKPPHERPSVQQMILDGRRPWKYAQPFEPNTGLDYDPFHR